MDRRSLPWVGCLLVLAMLQLAAAVPLANLQKDPTWTDCGQGATTLTVTNVVVTPSPVKTGANFSLTVECTSAGDIQKGALTTKVYLAGINVHTETDALCSETTCPISAGGKAKISTTTYMPIVTPPGWYNIKLSGADQDELPAICADIHFSVVVGLDQPPQ